MALSDQTLIQLVIRTADRLGDLLSLTATANGTTLTFVDALNINSAGESLAGREIHFTSGSNDGDTSRVTGQTPASNLLTFTPAQVSTATNDTAILLNKRSRGFLYNEYKRAINNAIEEFNGMALVPTIETIGSAFSESDQTIAVPATMRECYMVEFQDSDDQWQEIPQAPVRGGSGWTAEPSAGVIRVKRGPAGLADGYTVRLHGAKEQAQLTTNASICGFDGHAIAACAAFNLCQMGMDRDIRYGSLLLSLKDDYERSKSRVLWLREPTSVIVSL